MKVTLQESLSRAGIAPEQYQNLIQQQQQQQQQQAGAASSGSDSLEMGRQLLYTQTVPDSYTLDQLSTLFEGNPDDFDADLDDAGSPSPEEYEAFARMLGGIAGLDMPQSMQSGKPNSMGGKVIVSDQQPLPSTSSDPASLGPEQSTGVIKPLEKMPVRSWYPLTVPAGEETSETPKMQIKLRKAQDERAMSAEAGMQILENILTGQVQNPVLSSAPQQEGFASTVQSVGPGQTISQKNSVPVYIQEDSLSPAPSVSSEAPSIHVVSQDAMPMDTTINQEDSLSSQGQHLSLPKSTSVSTSENRGTRKTTASSRSPPPGLGDASRITDKPVKTKPVDVDSVLERNKKNAIQARINRQKKKEYMESLEESVEELRQNNERLDTENKRLTQENITLREELEYVKGVLANQSTLADLLKGIGKSTKASLSSSFFRKRTSTEADMEDQRPRKIGSGICLHVDKDNVSLEACSKCSKMAQGASRYSVEGSADTS